MKVRYHLLGWAFAIVAVFDASVLSAQALTQGSIEGALNDTKGLGVARAIITATAVGTQETNKTSTDSSGVYQLILRSGSYTVRISASGFKTGIVQDLTVRAGEAVKLNETLVSGSETDVVPLINPGPAQGEKPGAESGLADSSIKNIPLSSRNYTQATGLAPGVSSQVSNATNIGINTQGVQVGSGTTNNYMMDGAPVASTTQGPDSPGIPNPDAIEENNTQAWSYSAGPERYSGANISVVTKSGTGKFHGTLFEFVRNDIFNANDFFVKRAGFPEPVLKQNQFGFTLGGPVWRDRAFFFASYQGTRQRNGFANAGFAPSVILPPVPSVRTAAALGAAFCPADHPGDSRYSTVFGGVQVACDGSNINPVAIAILSRLKLSDGAYAIPGSTNGTFQQQPFSIPASFQEDQLLFNTDYVLTSKHKLTEKFFYSYDPQTSNFTTGPSSLPGTPSTTLGENIYSVVRLASTLTPSLSNEMRIAGKHELAKDTPHIPFTNEQVGISSVVSQIGLMDQIGVAGLFSFGGNGIWDYNSINQYEAADQVTWMHRRQTLRIGFEVDRRQWNINVLGDAMGGLSFSSFPDFLLGLPGCPPDISGCSIATPVANNVLTNGSSFSNVFASFGPGGSVSDVTGPSGIEHAYRFSDSSGYVHDDIRLLTRLTLSAGIRWDYFGLPSDSTGNMTSFWPILANPWVAPPPGGTYAGFVVPANFKGSIPAEVTRSITRSTRNTPIPVGSPRGNVAPRLSFSLQPFSKKSVVVRGGYGLFYDRPDAMAIEFVSTAEVPYAVPVGGNGQANYRASLANPFQPAAFGWGSPRTADATSNLNIGTLDENLSTPQTQKWNLEIQDQLPHGVNVLVGYAGAHSIRLLNAERQINEAQLATPGHPLNGFTTSTVENAPLRVPYLGIAANGLNVVQTQGAAKFNGVHVLASEQTRFGLHVQGTYSFSKTLANIGANSPSPSLPGPMASIGMDSNDPLDARQQYGPANLGGAAPPQRLAMNYGWDLPLKFSGFKGRLFNGWGFSGITMIASGSPITAFDSRGGTIYGGAGVSRAQFCPGMSAKNAASSGSVKQRLNAYFNPSAFCAPPTIGDGYGYGNSGVGFILVPGQANSDLSVSKNFALGDSRIEFRAEFFNAFNHPQFGGPDASVTDSSFGQITSTSVNPRLIQFALKYSF